MHLKGPPLSSAWAAAAEGPTRPSDEAGARSGDGACDGGRAAAPRGRRGLAVRAGEGGKDWSAAGRDQAGAASAVRGALEPVRAG